MSDTTGFPGQDFRGVCPVLEVPFTEDEDIDHAGFDRVLENVLASGVPAVMFPGFASEFHKLSVEERRRLRDRTLEVVGAVEGRHAVISVPDHATRLAVAEAVSAVEAGADAINLLPSGFLNPSEADTVGRIAAVLRAVAPTPVILQHAPRETGAALTVASIKDLAAAHPNLAMVKVEATPPGPLVAALAAEPAPLPSLVGYAGIHLLDAWRRGASGVQPGCSLPEVYQEIWRLLEDGLETEATELHSRLLPYLTYFMTDVELIVALEKYVSVRRGWFTSDRCRAPGRPLDDHERALADALLAEVRHLTERTG